MFAIKKYFHVSVFVVLSLANLFIWYGVYWENRGDILTVAFMNVGQGDAIFIQAPNGNTIIIDGGPSSAITRELGKLLPFYNRSIDMLVVTNPDKDHFAGFIDVLNNYEVGEVLKPGTKSDTQIYAKLEKTIKEKNVREEFAMRGMKIILDKEYKISLDILFPDRDVLKWTPNDGSIVARLVYGNTSYMLMGDATKKTEGIVINNSEDSLQSTILKLGHHGSKTSSGYDFVKAVAPRYAIISAGFHNKYGHPHKETLDTLEFIHIPALITFKLGTIVTESDGKRVNLK